MCPDGGPALEASWSHPTLKEVMALSATGRNLETAREIGYSARRIPFAISSVVDLENQP